jgi:GNAT superfamily N-acetyltransferase
MSEITLGGYRPGAIGRITELHAIYYHAHQGFDLFFEAKVAMEMAEFLNRFDPARDGFWVAMADGKIVGSVAIDGSEAETKGARLHRFIVAPEYQGYGIGKLLLQEAMAFCKRARYSRVYLTTFAGLDAARHLYEQWGFQLCEEHPGCT